MEKRHNDDVALQVWIVFWEETPLIDSLMKKMNKFQSQSDKPAAYFFVASPSESSIELESHWSFFNQSWRLQGPAVPKFFSGGECFRAKFDVIFQKIRQSFMTLLNFM